MSAETSAEIIRRLEERSQPTSTHLRIESSGPEIWATRIFLGNNELKGIITKVEMVLDWEKGEYNTVILHVIPETLGVNIEAVVTLKEAVVQVEEE